MADLLIYQTPNGGECDIRNGEPRLTEGLETAVFLSLFGGNELDDGTDGTARLQWWGNLSESDSALRYRSETQALLRSLPIIPANLRRIEDAAGRDLAWLVGEYAQSVSVSARMPALNTVAVQIAIEVDGRVQVFAFAWRKQVGVAA